MHINKQLYEAIAKYKPMVDQSYIAAAVKKKDQQSVILFADAGEDINKFESEHYFKRTPIFYAVFNNDIPMVQLLLSLNADINVTDMVGSGKKAGKSPLEYAMTRTKNIEMVKVLVEEGHADINAVLTQHILDNTPKAIVDYIQSVKEKQKRSVAQSRLDITEIAKVKGHSNSRGGTEY